MTPEERRSIFADVKARSKSAKEKRRKGMAATIADTIASVKEKAAQPGMAADLVVAPKKSKMSVEKKGVIGLIKRRKEMLKEALDS